MSGSEKYSIFSPVGIVDLQHMDSGELGSSPHASSFLPQSLPDFQPQSNALPVPNSSHSFEASSVPPEVPHNMSTHGFGGDTLANLQQMGTGDLGSSPNSNSFLPQPLPGFQLQSSGLPVPHPRGTLLPHDMSTLEKG